jgi:predicted ATPase
MGPAIALRGAAMARLGRCEEGIGKMQEGQAANPAIGTGLALPDYLSRLAEAFMETGRFDDGLNALAEAEAAADKNEDRQNEAERHRIKGELLLRQDDSPTIEAENCFRRAVENARKQSAKTLELRATMSLAHLLAQQGRRDEARAMLSDIYDWFTEGFETADLKDAKALLDELIR